MTSTNPTSIPVNPTPTPFTLAGKTAIVTGAGSGINLSFATLLLSAGCNVILADLALRPEAQSLIDQHPSSPRALFLRTDVTQWAELDALFAAADSHFGGVDLVCPGAGVFEPPWSSFWHPPGTAASRDAPDAGGYALLDINLVHPIRMTQMALARWLDPPAGTARASCANPKRVVHVASVAGLMGGLMTPLYHASKHGVVGLVRSMAGLEALGVRVSGVCPGLIWTPMWAEHADKDRYADRGKGAWLEPEEVARGMLALATDERWKGGSLIEITRPGVWREVKVFGYEGPDLEALAGFDGRASADGVRQRLMEPGWGTPQVSGKTAGEVEDASGRMLGKI